MFGAVELLGDQTPIPGQDRVGLCDASHLSVGFRRSASSGVEVAAPRSSTLTEKPGRDPSADGNENSTWWEELIVDELLPKLGAPSSADG